jgi:hypothetical protein
MSSIGPVIGAAFADSSATWRWSFYINLCAAAVSGPICIWLIPSLSLPTWPSVGERIRNLDIIGMILYFGALASFIMILAFGGSVYDWTEGRMIALYATSGGLWVIFAIQQQFKILCQKPVFPARFFRDWEILIQCGMVGLAISNLIMAIYTLPLFFQFAFGDSALRSATNTLPYIASAIVGSGLSGEMLPKFPRYMPWYLIGSVFMVVGSALESTIDYGTSRSLVFGFTVIQGFGAGLVAQLPYTVAHAKNKPSDMADINTFLLCGSTAGVAISLGVATCVFVNIAANDISAILPNLSRDAVVASVGGVGTSILKGLDESTKNAVLEVIGRTTGKVFYMNVAGGALGLLFSIVMKRERLVMHT